jgi:16S rRNA (adenine1518-N6/adenine1519-N6)-dimethyltransferase
MVETIGMFQKEVAERICSKPKSKKYGILSVLTQAYFKCEYLFEVSPNNFHPKPKVDSAVIKLTRNNTIDLSCSHNHFSQVVKAGFNQRRKKLKNALKKFSNLEDSSLSLTLSKRAEELSVNDFIMLTNQIFSNS